MRRVGKSTSISPSKACLSRQTGDRPRQKLSNLGEVSRSRVPVFFHRYCCFLGRDDWEDRGFRESKHRSSDHRVGSYGEWEAENTVYGNYQSLLRQARRHPSEGRRIKTKPSPTHPPATKAFSNSSIFAETSSFERPRASFCIATRNRGLVGTDQLAKED